MSRLAGPPGRSECEPDALYVAIARLFGLRNRRRPNSNFINADVSATGRSSYHVENLPPDGLGCPGAWLFEQAWSHFAALGVVVVGIREEWFYGTSLDAVNALTAGDIPSLEQAAVHNLVWGFRRASSRGFASVRVLGAVGRPGAYSFLDLLYEP